MAIFFLVALVIVVVALWVDWRGLFVKLYGNNPDKAVIFMKWKGGVEQLKGKREYLAKEGQVYLYERNGMPLSVAVPGNYPYEFTEGRRIIAVNEGEASAAPFQIGKAKSEEGVCDVSSLIHGTVTVSLVKALTGKKSAKWIWFLLIGAAAIGAILLFNMITGDDNGDVVDDGSSQPPPAEAFDEPLPEDEYAPYLPPMEVE